MNDVERILPDFSEEDADALYIRLDGTSETSNIIPFKYGANMGNTDNFGSASPLNIYGQLPPPYDPGMGGITAQIYDGSAGDFTNGYIYFISATYPLLHWIFDGNVEPANPIIDTLGSSSNRWLNIYSNLGNFSGRITSSVSTGTAPFLISSTTVNSNLNADMVDGFNLNQDVQTTASPTFSALNLSATSNQIVLQSAGITTTITESGATSNKTFTLPNITGTAIVDAGTQTISGTKTFSSSSGIALSTDGAQLVFGTFASPTFTVTGTTTGFNILDAASTALLQYDSGSGSSGGYHAYYGESTFVDNMEFLVSTDFTWRIGGTTEMKITSTQIDLGSATSDAVNFIAGDGAAAPATNTIGVLVDYYGTSATRVLTTPNRWLAIKSNGTTYKIPLYS